MSSGCSDRIADREDPSSGHGPTRYQAGRTGSNRCCPAHIQVRDGPFRPLGASWAQCASLSQTLLEAARGGTSGGRCRSAAEPVSAGAGAGEEDGQGQDLLPGDRGVHEHQRDADPARSLGVRQVRQARSRLLGRLAPLRDPEDPPNAGPAQHRARRSGAAGRGNRVLADLRRAWNNRSRQCSTTTPRRSGRRSAVCA